MNQDIKQLWLNDLRGNMPLQGRYKLHAEDKFCVNGRLCELHRIHTGNGEWVNMPFSKDTMPFRNVSGYKTVDGIEYAQLPVPVMEWAELTQRDPLVMDAAHPINTLSRFNDNGESFSFIADLIQYRLVEDHYAINT